MDFKWKLNKPTAATADGWVEWEEQVRKEQPIAFFIQESIPDFFHSIKLRLWDWSVVEWWWKLKYRVVREHQYNIIRPRTLSLTYWDQQERILHGMMECLVDYYETKLEDQDGEWDTWYDEKEEAYHAALYKEIKEIYLWWTIDWTKREELDVDGKKLPKPPQIPKSWGVMGYLSNKHDKDPIKLECDRVYDIINDSEIQWTKKENEMLKRVIDIRTSLW